MRCMPSTALAKMPGFHCAKYGLIRKGLSLLTLIWHTKLTNPYIAPTVALLFAAFLQRLQKAAGDIQTCLDVTDECQSFWKCQTLQAGTWAPLLLATDEVS
jgi:hypothetical protein